MREMLGQKKVARIQEDEHDPTATGSDDPGVQAQAMDAEVPEETGEAPGEQGEATASAAEASGSGGVLAKRSMEIERDQEARKTRTRDKPKRQA